MLTSCLQAKFQHFSKFEEIEFTIYLRYLCVSDVVKNNCDKNGCDDIVIYVATIFELPCSFFRVRSPTSTHQ